MFNAEAGGGGFLGRGDVFAEVIESGEDVLLLKAAGDGDDIVEVLAGDKAAGEAGSDGGGFHPATEQAAAGEEEKRGSQHTGLIPFYGS